MKKRWRIAGINFDHMHMGDLLRMAREHPDAEIVGVCDEQPERMRAAVTALGITLERVFTDWRACMETTKPDFVILCPATAEHARWTQRVAEYRPHILVEKPFAATLAQADAMIAAAKKARRQLVINWPLRWVPAHITTKRLIDEGRIGEVIEVHFYDGNRGPLRHTAGKVEVMATTAREKSASWFYKKASGGGSLLDYLGYGTTLGTWFMGGRVPIEVTAVVDNPRGLEVDEHSVVIARYATGLSKFETRWGTFTDPWKLQPQPKCGFVVVGTRGTIASYDYEPTVRMQTETRPDGTVLPVDVIPPPNHNPIHHVLHCLEHGLTIEGPLSPKVSRIGQRIVDTAVLSARLRKTVKLLG